MLRALPGCCLVLSIGCGVRSANESARLAADGGGAASISSETAAASLQQTSQRIIYEADITVVVDDFAEAEKSIATLVKDHGGYLADVSIDRASGEQRSGRWQCRVPVDRFDAFLEEVADLGVPTSRWQTAQDVTEEFVDLEARIANKKRLEERIVNLLNESSGQIKDIIEVEQELARVRGEVEQMEGRLRYLTNRTELTTVTINVREERDYVPPQAPTLAGRASSAWSSSLAELQDASANLLVRLIYVTPWLFVIVVVLSPITWIVRRQYERGRESHV